MSDESEDYKQSHAFMRQALSLMHKHNITPNPLNFAVWYSYAAQEYANQNPEIYEDLDKFVKISGALSEEESKRLFEKYTCAFDQANLKNLQESLKNLSNQILTRMSDVARDSSEHGGELTKIAGELEDLSDKGDIDLEVIGQITTKAKQMAESGQNFSNDMNQAKDEVQSLKQELTRLKMQAITDSLTGLYNRRAFENDINDFLQKQEENLCLAMIDIDHFKKFNDNFGHLIGDRVIKHIAKILNKHFIDNDNVNVYRFGGEEFAILFSNTQVSKAKEDCEEIRETIESQRLKKRESKERLPVITVSSGIAPYSSKQTIEDFIQKADSLLYRAKEHGRNCVIVGE